MKDRTNKTIVVKIGGSTLGQHDTTLADLVELQKRHPEVIWPAQLEGILNPNVFVDEV